MEKRSSDEKKKPSSYTEDPLTEVLRKGACALLVHAVGAESTAFLGAHAKIRDAQGHQMMVRNGYLPERINSNGHERYSDPRAAGPRSTGRPQG